MRAITTNSSVSVKPNFADVVVRGRLLNASVLKSFRHPKLIRRNAQAPCSGMRAEAKDYGARGPPDSKTLKFVKITGSLRIYFDSSTSKPINVLVGANNLTEATSPYPSALFC